MNDEIQLKSKSQEYKTGPVRGEYYWEEGG
jgi:hypothetical protein